MRAVFGRSSIDPPLVGVVDVMCITLDCAYISVSGTRINTFEWSEFGPPGARHVYNESLATRSCTRGR